MSAPDSMCDSFRGKYRSRFFCSFKHVRRHCFQSWFLNYDSLSNANLCYERLVAGSKVLSSSTKTRHEPSQPGKRLLTRPDRCSTQILCERNPSPTPWSVFCLEIHINFLSCYYTGRSRDIYMQGQNRSHLLKPIFIGTQIETSIRSRLVLQLHVFLCKSITLV